MKNTNKRFTRKIAAFLAAVMAMTTMASIGASAEDTEIKPEEFVCTWEVHEEKMTSIFEQIQRWIDQITQKKTASHRKRLVDMSLPEIKQLIRKEYNMTLRQFYDAAYYLRSCLRFDFTLEQTEDNIRTGMKRASDFRCEPTWNEDMIRFLKDYWDEFTEFVRATDLESIRD